MCFRHLVECLFCCCRPSKEEGLNETTFYDYLDALPVFQQRNIAKLTPGESFTFTGYILAQCERFSINFAIDTIDDDVALHINPRLPQNYIVRNTKVKSVWGREEVSSALPFSLHRGAKFTIQVFVTEVCYMISVNGNHFAEYNHRLPYKTVTTIEVKGDVEQVEMERATVKAYPSRLESPSRHIRLSAELDAEDDGGPNSEVSELDIPQEWRIIHTQSVFPISPSVTSNSGYSLPYYGPLPPNSLKAGRCLKIEGRVKLLPHSFYVNLQQGQQIWPHPIVAFHFNPRFSKQSGAIGKAIVCQNAWYNGGWAEEERFELNTDFRPGKTFSLSIECHADWFEVYVNRKFMTQFRYRVSPEVVDTVYIQGDIKLWDVLLENTSLKNKRRLYENPTYTNDDFQFTT